ncbi:MAG: tRNA 2-selenouridine(34) synthase MnmH [Pseudomonadota bacterium]
MIERIDDLARSMREQFDEIIDVRSPAEFAEDHIPDAVNLPVLSDDERTEVGTIYCQESRQHARRIGASYVTRNISEHLTQHFADKPNSYRPLIYCWRGGMRSESMATILNSVGWYSKTVSGGYRSWRQEVVKHLRNNPLEYRFILIDGQTGTNKTKVLSKLATKQLQILDLECLAQHRGSVFGSLENNKQPSQKMFESMIFDELSKFDPSKPIFVEAESPKIGRRALPASVVDNMRRSPRIELRAAPKTRAKGLVATYSDLVCSPRRLLAAIEYLRPYHSRSKIEQWKTLTHDGDFEELAFGLVTEHYDPCYARQRRKRNDSPIEIIEMNDLDDDAISSAATKITQLSNNAKSTFAPAATKNTNRAVA